MGPRFIALFSVIVALAMGSGGCDDDAAPDADSYALNGDSRADEDIASDLADYIAYNYGRPEEPDREFTPEERERLGPLADNAGVLHTSIEGISVRDSVITIGTDLDGGEEGTTTAELICTVIYGADVVDGVEGHAVTGSDGSTLVTCTTDTSPFEFVSLSAPAQRLVEYAFTGLGASLSEARCAIEAFTVRVGVDELNAAAAEFKAGQPGRFMSHRLDLAAVAEECDVDDHRQVKDCDDPKDEDERLLCREFQELGS